MYAGFLSGDRICITRPIKQEQGTNFVVTGYGYPTPKYKKDRDTNSVVSGFLTTKKGNRKSETFVATGYAYHIRDQETQKQNTTFPWSQGSSSTEGNRKKKPFVDS